MNTLTRLQAHELIDAYGDDVGVLARHWIGHDEFPTCALIRCLHDYVDECATSDEERERGPRDDDDTGLTDPDAAQPRHNYARDNALAALSDVLINWQVSQGLPQQCAHEALTGCGRGLTHSQRDWLRAFVTLWDLTDV